MRRRISNVTWIAALCFVMLFSVSRVGAEQYELSLKEAVHLALEADIDYQIALLTWENAEIDHKITAIDDNVTPYESLERERNFRRAENTFAQAHNDLVLDILRDYVSLKRAAVDLDVRTREVEVAEIELAQLEEKRNIGNATEQEHLQELNRVETARLRYESAQRTYETQRKQFIRRLGLPEDVQLVVEDTLPIHPFDYELEHVLEQARQASFHVWDREAAMELARLDLEKVRSQNVAPLTLQKAENDFRIEQLQAEKEENRFMSDTVSAYYDIADAWRELANAERDYAVAQEQYNQTLRQYEVNLITDLVMKKAEIDFLNARQTLRNVQNDYALSLLEFEVMLGRTLPYGEETAP